MMLVLYILVILLTIAIVMVRLRKRPTSKMEIYADLRKYLLGELTLANIGNITKPILWIHVPLEYNSRKWESFGSRSSFDLNQPYLHLTVQTIINKCQDSFHIVIIDDTSFNKVLPEWTLSARTLSSVSRTHGFLQLLYIYGGMITPISFVCFKDLIGMYDKGTRHQKMFICENVNYNTVDNYNFIPDTDFMGSPKGNPTILHLCKYIRNIEASGLAYTEPTNMKICHWIINAIKEKNINIIHGYDVGIMDKTEHPITLDDMMSSDYIQIDAKNAYGIWIPHRQILKRFKYQWFARMSESQIEESKIIICKYILHSYITDKTRSMPSTLHDEYSDPVIPTNLPPLVQLWDTPLYKGLYGLKPIYLGDGVMGTT